MLLPLEASTRTWALSQFFEPNLAKECLCMYISFIITAAYSHDRRLLIIICAPP